MYEPLEIDDRVGLVRFCGGPDWPALTPEMVLRHKADAHWLLAGKSGQVVARCSLWWQATPAYLDHRLGLIGHYAADSAGAAAELLNLACTHLAEQGCTLAVGPMDGNTWRRYRLITERGSEPSFFLEPDHPDGWPDHFTKNGFEVLARYRSTLNTNLKHSQPRLQKVAARAVARGLQIRPANLDQFAGELHRIYRLALASFSRNLLYTPLSAEDFVALYAPLRPYLRPELVLIAECAGQPLGFIFALPDLLQVRRGQPSDTVILKTVAVHPDHQMLGLGSLLVARCQALAGQLGYRRAIHALMHDGNDSRKISQRDETRTIRQYGLYSKELRIP